MKWITSTNLVDWSGKKSSEGMLPEVIRKLIIGSVKKFPQISFPANDSIYKPGWDGKTITEEEYKYVPKGITYWELGRDGDYKKKCNGEYNKRTKQTKLKDRRNATFIFVTPRRWVKAPLKDQWIADKLKKKQWGDVRIYDADDLELWLEQTPAIATWLSRELKLYSENVVSAFDYWQRFRDVHKLTPKVVIAGRNKESSEIVKFISGDYGVKEIQSSSKAEAISFSIAAGISSSDSAQQDFFSKSIIVSNREALRQVVSQHTDLNIIYDVSGDDALTNHDAGQNHLLIPVSFKVKSNGISIPLPDSLEFIKSLEAIGFNFQKASGLSRHTGRSFSVLSRTLANAPGRVAWSQGNDTLELIPIFFANKLDDRKEGDRETIAQLANQKSDLYFEKLKAWSLIFDNPIYQVANHWKVASPYDLLHVVAKSITEGHLNQFDEVLTKVLTEINPALELEPKLRYAAAIFRKQSIYSERFKEGLCQSLVLLAVHGESAGINVGFSLQSWTDRIVKDLLSNKKLEFWLSIEGKLHLLAEASPDSFLYCLEEFIKNDPVAIGSMFRSEGFDLFTPTYYVHILWALESLAWDPRYIARAVLILAKLSMLDESIKTANKPINSLLHIFLPWLPQTYATVKEREEVLDLLMKRSPVVALKLLKEISPKMHSTGMHNYKPLFRLRDYTESKVTNVEFVKMNSIISTKLQSMAENSCEKWSEIIELIDNFEGDDRTTMIASLTSITDFQGDMNLLKERLHAFIHRQEIIQAKSLTIQELKTLESFYESLLSTEVDKYYWYFNVDTIERYGATSDNYETLVEKTKEKRKQAIASILQVNGFEGIIELANRVEHASVVGYILAHVKSDFDDEMINFLNDVDVKLNSMASSYLYQASIVKGLTWVQEKTDQIKEKGSSVLASFFLSVEPTSSNWNLLETVSEEANSIYWQKVSINPFSFKSNTDDLLKCIRTLHQFKRYGSSVNMIMYNKEVVPGDLIVDALEGLATNKPEGQLHLGAHAIHELFKQLDNVGIDENKMELLEWYYLDILNDRSHSRPIKRLSAALEKPDFFAQILSWAYKPENAIDVDIPEAERSSVASRARNADRLLDSWGRLPGERDDFSIDADVLKNWMSATIIECKKLDRENKSYYVIGKLFGIAKERSKNWPQDELCEIIEDFNNKELNSGFVTGCINGSRVRASLRPSGSEPERTQEEHYRSLSLKLANRFPVVSGLINEVANHYERWAKHMEADDAQRHLED